MTKTIGENPSKRSMSNEDDILNDAELDKVTGGLSVGAIISAAVTNGVKNLVGNATYYLATGGRQPQ
jgi:hypothetical protein